jgi:hypothetical protein
MTLCQWRGARVERDVVTRPTLEQVVAAVQRLDNRAFNDLYLEPDGSADDTWLCVGGGAGRYLLSGSISNERFPTLVDPARQPEPVEALVVGGQEGSYPGNQVHGLKTALDVVRGFWTTGRFEGDSHTWLDI